MCSDLVLQATDGGPDTSIEHFLLLNMVCNVGDCSFDNGTSLLSFHDRFCLEGGLGFHFSDGIFQMSVFLFEGSYFFMQQHNLFVSSLFAADFFHGSGLFLNRAVVLSFFVLQSFHVPGLLL